MKIEKLNYRCFVYLENLINDSTNSISADVRGRLLETSLLLHLIQELDVFSILRNKLVRIIQSNMSSETEPMLCKCIAAFMESKTLGQHSVCFPYNVETIVQRIDAIGTDRKKLLFQIICAELGILQYTDIHKSFLDGKVDILWKLNEYQHWTRVMLCAVKILGTYLHSLRHEYNVTQSMLHEENLFLASAIKHPDIKCYSFAYLLAMLALSKSPLYAEQAMQNLVDFCRIAVIDANGVKPFQNGLDIFCSAVVGFAINHAKTNLRLRGRKDPELLCQYITSVQQRNGSWAYTRGVLQGDCDTTTSCILFLLSSVNPSKYKTSILNAVDYLLSLQSQSGGFPTFDKGQADELEITANAFRCIFQSILVLKLNFMSYHERLLSAAEYMTSFTEPREFPNAWSISQWYVIKRVSEAIALVRNNRDILPKCGVWRIILRKFEKTSRDIGKLLLDAQNPDGGWGCKHSNDSHLFSTFYALCCQECEENNVLRGLAYIESQAHDDRLFSVEMDQLGPRPIPYYLEKRVFEASYYLVLLSLRRCKTE